MLARQQAAAEKLRKKQVKKSKKLKKSKDLDALIAKKCKQLLGGLDLKKLDALENDTSSLSSSSDLNSHGYKKKKKRKDLDKLLALKYKKLLGKVDQKVLNELSSSSESESSGRKKYTKKVLSSSSESESSSVDKKKKQVSATDGRRLKRNRLKSNKERRTRGSSSESRDANWEQKKKMHSESKVLDKRKDTSKENQINGPRDEDNRNSKWRKEFDERKTRHEKCQYNRYDGTRTDSEDVKNKQNNQKHNYKTDAKPKVEDKPGQKYSRKRLDSSSSSNESRGKKKKPSEIRGKPRKMTKLTASSNSDSDTSINKKKNQEKKHYGLVLPANYVPKKKADIETRKPAPEKTTDVKKYRKEDRQRLTEEEKERRLKEMMTNAKWRDDLRETNIKNYQKKIEAEKDNHEYNEDFMRNQMSYAMSQGTVESRVKAKINTIQRNKGSMSENFARRN